MDQDYNESGLKHNESSLQSPSQTEHSGQKDELSSHILPNPEPIPIYALFLQKSREALEHSRWGKQILSIPTPLILAVFFISLFSFGFYLWEDGREILLYHISRSLVAYILIITIVTIIWLAIRHKDNIFRFINGKSMLESRYYRYRHDLVYKIRVTLFCSLLMNILFVCLKSFAGLLYHSAWFLTLGFYYLLLAVLRTILLLYLQKQPEDYTILGEWRRYRACGIILLMMNHVLSAMVGYIVTRDHGFIYPGILLYGMIIYTGYALCSALYSLIRFRKYGAPILSAAKIVSLTAALVSMLALETALISTFGGVWDTNRRIILAASGSCVCSAVMFLSLYMIIRSTHKIHQLKKQLDLDSAES